MDILVLGGTGAMGSHVSEFLMSQGYNVFIQVETRERILVVDTLPLNSPVN